MIEEGNSKKFVSVNSLSIEDRKYLKGVVEELNDSLLRIDAEKDLQKEAITNAADKLNVDPKIIKEMGVTHHKANFNKKAEARSEFEEFYTIVMNGVTT